MPKPASPSCEQNGNKIEIVTNGGGRVVHLYGTLASNLPDYNGSQIQVVRIEVE